MMGTSGRTSRYGGDARINRRGISIAFFTMAFLSSTSRGEPQKRRRIGFLSAAAKEANLTMLKAFQQGLGAAGYHEAENLLIEYVWSEHQDQSLLKHARQLASTGIEVLVATGGERAARAALQVASEVPVVFTTGADPQTAGLINSVAKPDSNMTGASFLAHSSGPKIVELIDEIFPIEARIGLLVRPSTPGAKEHVSEISRVGATLKKVMVPVYVENHQELHEALTSLADLKLRGLQLLANPLFNTSMAEILSGADAIGLPVFGPTREWAHMGAVFSYGADRADIFYRAGNYVARILDGARPSSLPVILPEKFEFVINLRKAHLFGIDVPSSLLILADEIVE